jgi:ABC-type multidrug transport system fused ATPase/permease subunit
MFLSKVFFPTASTWNLSGLACILLTLNQLIRTFDSDSKTPPILYRFLSPTYQIGNNKLILMVSWAVGLTSKKGYPKGQSWGLYFLMSLLMIFFILWKRVLYIIMRMTILCLIISWGRQSNAFERSIRTAATYWFFSRAFRQSSNNLSRIVWHPWPLLKAHK